MWCPLLLAAVFVVVAVVVAVATRDRWVHDQGHTYLSSTKSSHMGYRVGSRKFRRHMRLVREELDEFHRWAVTRGWTYHLVAGNLIGWRRREGFVPWDDDVDVYLGRDDSKRFVKAFGPLPNESRWVTRTVEGHTIGYHARVKYFKLYGRNNADLRGGLDLFVDTTSLPGPFPDFRTKTEKMDRSMGGAEPGTVREVEYDGVNAMVPNNTEAMDSYLDVRYPGWRTPVHPDQTQPQVRTP